jgi:phosphoglucomutase/phosphomannomutase
MFSASHNHPTDNWKKGFDSNGGQLIPPHDEQLVDEVTLNVKAIERISFEEARSKGLVEEIGEELHQKYLESVTNQSLSTSRSAKILYSPLHGTGRNSIYDVLKKAGFEVEPEESTSNFSGKFENVVFNIPNPEVVQSFKTLINSDKADSVDLLINSDPDADRLGIMARDNEGDWRYFNGRLFLVSLSL